MFHKPSMLGRLWMGGSLVCLAAADGLAGVACSCRLWCRWLRKRKRADFFFSVGTLSELSPPAVPPPPLHDRLPSPPHPQMLLPVGRGWVVVRRLRSTQMAPAGMMAVLSGRDRRRTVKLPDGRQLRILFQSSGSYWHWLVLLT